MSRIKVEVICEDNSVPVNGDDILVSGDCNIADIRFGQLSVPTIYENVVVDLSSILDTEISSVMSWVNEKLIPAVDDDGDLTFFVTPAMIDSMMNSLTTPEIDV